MKVSLFHTITSNTLYQAIGKAISIVLGLVITALLTRHLGQAGYGQYTLITTVIILFGSATDWGSGFIATRMASKQEFPTDQVYGNLLILRIFMTVIGTLIMIAFGYFKIINLPLPLITLGSLVLFAMALHNSMQVIFQVQLKLQYGAIVGAVSSLAFLIFTILAVNQTTITPQEIDDFTRSFKIGDVYRDVNDDIADSGTLDPGTKKFDFEISWTDSRGTSRRALSTYFTDFFNN